LADHHLAGLATDPEFGNVLSERSNQLVKKVSSDVLDTVLAPVPEVVRENHELRRQFEITVERVWGKPLDLLYAFYGICIEIGQDCNSRYRDRAYDLDDFSWQAIVRLHARSCLVMSEVLSLLRSGHASGAHASWRTMHELAVVAFFLLEQGDDVARRYLEHDGIQTYKSALSHRRYGARLNEEPLTDAEFETAQRRRDELVAKYGRDFKRDCGWAASVLPGQGRTFAEVEAATKLDHMRPYYKMASHAIHPNARGLFFDLGLGDDDHLLLAGPSTRGVADAGVGALIALYQSTIALLSERIDFDEAVTMLVLQQMVPIIEDALMTAHEEHEAEVVRRRAERDDSTPGIPPDVTID
jgi:hypothetical protein